MRRRTAAAALPLLLVLAGCTGGASPSAAPSDAGGTASPAPSEDEYSRTPGPETPLPAAACPEIPEPTGTMCFTVAIRDFAFAPAALTIPATARIVFVNEDGAAHSIAWADGTPTSPSLATGDSTERSFSGAASATLDYACGIHGSRMSGRIIVDASLPVP